MKYRLLFLGVLFALFVANLGYGVFQAFWGGRSEADIMADLNGCVAQIPRFEASSARVAEWRDQTGFTRESEPYEYAKLLGHEAELCGDWYTRGPKLICDQLGDPFEWKNCIEAALVPLLAKLETVAGGLEQRPEFLTRGHVAAARYRDCRLLPPTGMDIEEEAVLDVRCQLSRGHLALGQASLIRHIEAAR